MKKIVTNRDLMEQMGKRSQEIFIANFAEDIIIDKYINLYDGVNP